MDVGNGAIISDKWIPDGEDTGILDITGRKILTRDKVKVNGMGADFAYVGRNSQEELMLYFGRKDGVSIGWYLTQEKVERRKIKVLG